MEINFHIPDFSKNIRLNIKLIDTLFDHPEWFHDGLRIASSYGAFYPSLWNGGRNILGQTDDTIIRPIIKAYNDRGVPVRFTFTNLMLTEKHLSDEFCNKQLELANNGLNEVIIASDLLENYIREKYPKYKLTSSTCKQIEDVEELKKELEKDYYLVVLDYNLNHEMEILESLPHKEKCEILVNACCVPNCKLRGAHYRAIGQEIIDYDEWIKNPMNKSIPYKCNMFECPNVQQSVYDDNQYKTRISPTDILEKFIPMGYKHFKLEGRTSNTFNVLENYIHYLVKDEYKNKCRLHMELDLANKNYLPEFIFDRSPYIF